MSLQSTGNRNKPVNPSQPLVGMYGWSACRLGIWSMTWLAIATITVATIAPGPESVSVEMNSPTAMMPDAATRMYTPDPSTRRSASHVVSVVPLSVGSGPNPNTAPPATRPARITPASNAPVSVIADRYLATI